MLYFDLDGVLAKFDTSATIEEVLTKGFVLSREPQKNVCEAFKILAEKIPVRILTSTYKGFEEEKRIWVEKNLGRKYRDNVICVPYGTDKNSVVFNSEISMLFDDNTKMLNSFNGVKVKCVNDINDTHHSFTGYRVDIRNASAQVIANTLMGIYTIEGNKCCGNCEFCKKVGNNFRCGYTENFLSEDELYLYGDCVRFKEKNIKEISEKVYDWLDLNGGVFSDKVMKIIGADVYPPDRFQTSGEYFHFLLNAGVSAILNNILSFDELTN